MFLGCFHGIKLKGRLKSADTHVIVRDVQLFMYRAMKGCLSSEGLISFGAPLENATFMSVIKLDINIH